jgi:flagellar hook-associated protein 3 FlgL
MRISDNRNRQTVQRSLDKIRSRLEEIQKQGASLKKVNTPSDDPVGNARLMNIRTDNADNKQYVQNITLARSFLNYTDSALGDLYDIGVRAKELAIQQASGATQTQEAREAVAEEVEHLYRQALSVANRKIGDRHIFGGFHTSKAPFTEEGNYRGDSGQVMVEIGEKNYIGLNVPGDYVFLGEPMENDLGRVYSEGGWKVFTKPHQWETNQGEEKDQELVFRDELNRSPAADGEQRGPSNQKKTGPGDFFELIEGFHIALRTGDVPLIQNTVEQLDGFMDHILNVRAQIGTRVQSVEATQSDHEREEIQNAQVAAEIDDVDMAKLASDMAREESALKASLNTAQRLIQPTLLDYVR